MDSATLITSAVAAIAAVAAGYERYKGQKLVEYTAVNDAKDKLLEVLNQEILARKEQYEREHLEYTTYREETHKRLDKAAQIQSELLIKNAELESKTNIVPIMDTLKNVVSALERVMIVIERLEKSTK